MAELLIYTSQDDKLMGAIEYTNLKYGHEIWYPALLQRSVNRYLTTTTDSQEQNTPTPTPLHFLKRGPQNCSVYGGDTHFIIRQVEDYARIMLNTLKYRCMVVVCFILLISAILFIR